MSAYSDSGIQDGGIKLKTSMRLPSAERRLPGSPSGSNPSRGIVSIGSSGSGIEPAGASGVAPAPKRDANLDQNPMGPPIQPLARMEKRGGKPAGRASRIDRILAPVAPQCSRTP